MRILSRGSETTAPAHSFRPGTDDGKDLFNLRQRVGPQPGLSQPESGYDEAMNLLLARGDLPVAALRPQRQHRHLLLLWVDNPVFGDARPLILRAFHLVIAAHTLR